MILLIELSQKKNYSNKVIKGIKQLLTVLKGYTQPDPTTALELLAQQLLKYPNLQSGYNLSSPVPADLLLPFSDFVTKYGIQDAAPLIMNFKAIGDVLDTPTLYIFQTLAFVNSRLSQLVDTWLLLITTTASSTQRQPKCSDPPFYTVAQWFKLNVRTTVLKKSWFGLQLATSLSKQKSSWSQSRRSSII